LVSLLPIRLRKFDHDNYLCAAFISEPARTSVMSIRAFNIEVAHIRHADIHALMMLLVSCRYFRLLQGVKLKWCCACWVSV